VLILIATDTIRHIYDSTNSYIYIHDSAYNFKCNVAIPKTKLYYCKSRATRVIWARGKHNITGHPVTRGTRAIFVRFHGALKSLYVHRLG